MTRVDFYILPDDSANGREMFACRLVEKAYKLGHTLYLHTESRQQAGRIDEILWTFKAGSFLPHAIDGDRPLDEPPPILIGHSCETPAEPHSHSEVLINLAPTVPSFFSRFERVAELVNQADDHRATGRARFKFYRDRGYPLESHKL